ncbi:ArsR/SmtB family transcription factor [Agromyces sp. NPDC056965]|uniref:ArsR/SmtB family transcription factor n=1 Tax=Agromyces sp. NPDC056965 TaxID=3345983 RepID=UPI0036385E67
MNSETTSEALSARLAAIASPQRMRIIAVLHAESLHVSELARRLGMSRALLYMHLTKLEEAGFVAGHLEMSDGGKALKFFELVPFAITIDAAALAAAVANDPEMET